MQKAMPEIVQGDARALDLPDESVDLIITSPPFLNLRAYTDAGRAYDGQIGAGTRDEFLKELWQATAEMARVLKPTGSIFVELGDSYTDKTLNLSPHRYAIGCVDRLGLYLRAEIIWDRPNGLPEPVQDRARRSHSVWFHLTKSPKYFAAVDEIREPHAGEYLSSGARNARHGKPSGRLPNELRGENATNRTPSGEWKQQGATGQNPLGKLPGSVWTIPTQPLRVPAELGIDHFASFPMAWPRRLVLGWSPREVCTACGEGRRPVADSERGHRRGYSDPASNHDHGSRYRSPLGRQNGDKEPKSWRITGYACACPDTTALSTPGVVLDPFGGTGTTALVAAMHGRRGVSVDLSADYNRLAEWRASDPKERARAAGLDPDKVTKTAPQLPGQFDLFGDLS